MVAMSTMLYPRASAPPSVVACRVAAIGTRTFVITCHTSQLRPVDHPCVPVGPHQPELAPQRVHRGGLTIASPVLTSTTADSWSLAAATSTGVRGQADRAPRDPNGYLYRCVVANVRRVRPDVGHHVRARTVDGTVVWLNIKIRRA